MTKLHFPEEDIRKNESKIGNLKVGQTSLLYDGENVRGQVKFET